MDIDSLCDGLRNLPGPQRDVDFYYICSQPRPCKSLYPWSSVHHAATIEEILVVVMEPLSLDDPKSFRVPVFALEASLYRNVGSNKSKEFPPRSLLYISKIDTTGLIDQRPSMVRDLTSTLIRKLGCDQTFVFARSQTQYLFPGSAKNPAKRLIDDRKLAAWWTRTLAQAQPSRIYWVLGGYSAKEARNLLSPNIPPFKQQQQQQQQQDQQQDEKEAGQEKEKEKDGEEKSRKETEWVYGHPYNNSQSIADQIPSFVDDPKARYLCSLCSSRLSPAGEEGNLDELYESLARMAPAAQASQREIMQADRARERERLDAVPVEEFWESIGYRQECADGHVAAFFVADTSPSEQKSLSSSSLSLTETSTEPSNHDETESTATTESTTRRTVIGKNHYAIPYGVYVKYWSMLHNINYNSLEKVQDAIGAWTQSLESWVSDPTNWSKMHKTFTAGTYPPGSEPQSEQDGSNKREQENAAPVNILAPRKKKKI